VAAQLLAAFLLQSCCSVARLHLDKPASGPFRKNVEGSVSRVVTKFEAEAYFAIRV